MLDLVFESRQRRGEENQLDIVAIPAVGLNKPTSWLDSSGTSWLQNLVDGCVARITVWEYAYKANLQESVAKQLIREGFHLVEALHSHCTKPRYKKVPIVFICHGSGGFVLKKYYHLRPVIDVVSGFIFLGSPHLIGDIEDAKKSFDLLAKCRNSGTVKALSSLTELSDLIEVCKSFERLGIQGPVVSAYETKETHLSSGLFAKFRSRTRGHMIVPESLSTLRVHSETSVDSKSNHTDICNLPIGSELYNSCENLIMEVLHTAPQRIAENDKPYIIPVALKDDTLRSPSTACLTRFEDVDLTSQPTSLPISSPADAVAGSSTVESYELVPAVAALEVSARDPKLPCFILGDHWRKDAFVGREDTLKIIDQHLLPTNFNPDKEQDSDSSSEHSSDLRSFAICGLGGIGKTDKILASSFANLAVQLGLEDEDSVDVTASRDIVMGWLSRPLRQTSKPDEPSNFVNWLLIFDNVDNLDVLDDYWPKLGRGSVLITSRDPNAKQNMYIHEGLHLPPLTNTETEVLMQKLTHVRADDYQKDALAKIAKTLDGLPLVINQMSGLFRSFRLSYMDFLEFLQEEGIEKLYERQSGSTDKQKTQSLVTYWALDRLSSPTKALLQVMCLLDPDDIPEDILIDKSGQENSYRPPPPTSQKRNNKLPPHRLAQDATKAMMEKDQLVSAFQAAAKLVVSAWPFQSIKEHHSTVRFSKCEDMFPCVLRLKDGLKSILASTPDFPVDISLARLFNDTGWYMFERGLQEETKPFCDLALLIAERLKKTHGTEAIECIRESQQFLGIALVETNEHTLSMAHKQKWLDMLLERKSHSGTPIEDYELGYAYNEIGVAYGNADMIDEAIEAFVRSIEIFQGLDDYEDTMLGWPEPNLGFMYWLKGDLETAETALVEILDIHAAAWGVDDTHSFKTGKILYGLGNVLESQGRFDESLGFHLRCLEQYKKVLGMNHHRVGDVCHRLASHYMRKGLYKEAAEYLGTSLRIFKSRSYLANELARTTFKRSQLHRLMGEDSEADELREKAYKIRKKLKPGDTVPVEKLTEEDFDNLVAFWSR
ncbi:hypothetical protein CEP51_010797 [Fusarium floridanum]|uniref:DUF7779 domain-containing protein n=1 Tax=Fusarium floridanum TaxID=1325733 RepID=A0A428RDA8_9HYPO|nr:hypothetical protein CEP51_010797 [Fusarium floridanum]